MANQPVGAADNQFVIFLHGNCAAPIASENRPSPKAKAKSADAQDRCGNKDGIGLGNDLEVKRVGEMVSAEQEIPADQDQDHVAQALGSALAVDAALGEERSQ